MGLNITDKRKYLTILSDGTIRLKVNEGTENAVKREIEDNDGKKSVKWELVYNSIDGYITDIFFTEGDYGKNINVAIKDDEEYTLSLSTENDFGKDLMKKLPNVKFNQKVDIKPFSFTDENGKDKKGVTILQETNKVTNYFYDIENKKVMNGYPEPEGDKQNYDKDDWKAYYIKVKKFLVSYTEENVIPKITGELPKDDMSDVIAVKERARAEREELQEDSINPDDIPFN